MERREYRARSSRGTIRSAGWPEPFSTTATVSTSGGHRFFTKVSAVEALWREILGNDLLTRPRLSRIYYNGAFFSYPLKPFNALAGLGLLETVRCVASYGWARVSPTKPEEDFATWVSNRFGKRLFEIFFKTYTEKVWGIPCMQIDAEWAAQRIKGLSLTTAVKNALFGQRGKSKEEIVKTLIDEFLYPRHGPGMMWERTHKTVESMGSRVVLDTPIERILWSEGRVEAVRAGGLCQEDVKASCCTKDEGRSFGAAL